MIKCIQQVSKCPFMTIMIMLKKELTDRKIPASHRDEILLVCDNNRVLWACGVRRCEDCRVTGSTKNVFKIQLILKERN